MSPFNAQNASIARVADVIAGSVGIVAGDIRERIFAELAESVKKPALAEKPHKP